MSPIGVDMLALRISDTFRSGWNVRCGSKHLIRAIAWMNEGDIDPFASVVERHSASHV
jgi:hypothetical protein